MSAPLLELRDLRVVLPTARGPAAALRGVSFTMARGEKLGLIGESGCGKSLSALAIMGLLPEGARIEGSIRLNGAELVGLADDAMARLRGDRVARSPYKKSADSKPLAGPVTSRDYTRIPLAACGWVC